MTGAAALVVGIVLAIADDDMLTGLNADFLQVKVRLAESDTPEKRQAFATVPVSLSANSATRSALKCASSTSIDASASSTA